MKKFTTQRNFSAGEIEGNLNNLEQASQAAAVHFGIICMLHKYSLDMNGDF